ncbi:MAG: AAC(3) family N-acetyltransferase [Magnetococcales bacterium]|nr:AAC(3) family N-acetyltransferase [Magnetococcales bacterium]
MVFYESAAGPVTRQDFLAALAPPVAPGDMLYVQSDLKGFGKLVPGLTKTALLEGLFGLFVDLVGPTGHLVVPTYSYSWGPGSPERRFDVRHTRSQVGLFSEYARQRPDVTRTTDPFFSCVVWGPERDNLARVGDDAFGVGSIFDTLHQRNAWLLIFGLPRFNPTFLHYVEQYHRQRGGVVPYRITKEFTGTTVDRDGTVREGRHSCFVRDIDRFGNFGFNDQTLMADLAAAGHLVRRPVGQGWINLAAARPVLDISIAGMEREPFYFVPPGER